MWTDNETAEDLLGFQVHADLVASLVTDPGMLPVTIGLFGDWGSGKSSVMSMIQKSLDPELAENASRKEQLENVAVLYFNGWTFEGYDDAKAALLSTILIELGDHKRFGPKVRDGAAKLLKSVNWMRLAKMAVKEVGIPVLAAYVTGGASVLPQIANTVSGLFGKKPKSEGAEEASATEEGEENKWEDLIRKQPEDAGPTSVRAFRADFERLLKDSDIAALVVIIDDLDRCSPERIVENLEAIKLFLNVERTAFVIGADPRIVRHAVGVRYPRNDFKGIDGQVVADDLAKDYLEKLIQVPYSLPRLSAAEVESYMTLLFCVRELDPTSCGKVTSVVRARKGRERYGRFDYPQVQAAVGEGVPLPSSLASSLTFVKAAAPLVTEGLKGNPRQVKRFLNALILRQRLAEVAELTDLDDSVLVKLQVLEYTHDERFVELNSWQQGDDGFPRKLSDLENEADNDAIPDSSPWSDPFLVKWLKMEPRLAGKDLTEYFWVARDRLSAAYGGADLMPTIVKTALIEIAPDNKGKQRGAVKNLVQGMDDQERRQFLRALGNLFIAKPKDIGLFNAFVILCEEGIPDAPQAFALAVGQAPPDSLPASVGVELKMLMNAKGLQSVFQPLLDRIARTDTVAGRALKPSQPKKPTNGAKS